MASPAPPWVSQSGPVKLTLSGHLVFILTSEGVGRVRELSLAGWQQWL